MNRKTIMAFKKYRVPERTLMYVGALMVKGAPPGIPEEEICHWLDCGSVQLHVGRVHRGLVGVH
jgi:hypothetical protein